MDGLSAAASGFAVVSLADQLADRIKQLYEFWSAVSEAPANIFAIATELNLLRGVLAEISKYGQQYGAKSTTVSVLESCTQQVSKLVNIVEELQLGFSSSKRHVRKWSAVKAVFKEDKIKTFRDELERVKVTLLLILQVNNKPHMQIANEERPADLPVEGLSLKAKEESQAIVATQQEEREIIRALYLSDYVTKLDEIPTREPRTCEWVLNHKSFKEWDKIEYSALLWLSGNPGCGKTVISSFLIDTLKVRSDSTLIYFICDHKDVYFRTRESMLRSLLHQLFVSKPNLVRHALEPFSHMKDSMATSAKTLWTIFEDIFRDEDVGIVYCVLDALDECEDDARKWILVNLKHFFSKKTAGSLRLIVTSRPWEDIEIGLGKASKIRLKIEEEESINQDIRMFVDERVQSLTELRRYTPHQQEMVTEALIKGANGMFLWVSLIIDELERSPARNLERHLQDLPGTLYDVYDRIMDRIPRQSIERAMHILKWVVTAIRPLTPEELSIACEVEELDGLSNVDLEDLVNNIKGDIGLCGPIITIKHGYVVVVHKSVKDFLLANQANAEYPRSPARYHISLAQSHAQLLSLCLKYMSFKEFETPPLAVHAVLKNETPFTAFLRRFLSLNTLQSTGKSISKE